MENNLSLEKFNPNVAELNQLVEVSSKITVDDLKDKNKLAIAKEQRKVLGKARTTITNKGKALRQDAVDFQKAVIAHEKKLVAIVAPEEDRLKAIEQEAKDLKVKEYRTAELPARQEKLKTIGDGMVTADSILMSLDDDQFNAYFNQRTVDKIEADKEKIEKERLAEEEKQNEARRLMEEEKAKAEAEIAEQKRKADEVIAEEKRIADQKIADDQKKAQDVIDAQNKKIADDQEKVDQEKREIAKQKEIDESIKKVNAEAKIKAEQDRKDAEAKAMREAEEKKGEEARQEAVRPDKENLLLFVESVNAIPLPTLKTKEGIEIGKQVKTMINNFTDFVKQELK